MTDIVSTPGGGIAGDRGAWTPRASVPPFSYTQGSYRVRFAQSEEDVDRACALRYEVFNLELGEGLEESHATRRDRDTYDAQCDHLVVEECGTGAVVGTYRMQLEEHARRGIGFYSATEFDLSALPRGIVTEMVELGRACTAVEHRTRAVLNLLWRGMAAYLLFNKKRYFFGCSSLTSQDPALGLAAWRQLERRGYVHPKLHVPVLPAYACSADTVSDAPVAIPTLFTLYLRVGARVCGPPALDRFFGTIDFLTLLDTQSMDAAIFRSYVD